MKQIINLMLSFVICTAFQCEDTQQIRDVSKLCAYKNTYSETSNLKTATETCTSDNFITELGGLTGKIQFNSELDGFIVVTNVDGTYDCQIIGVLCNDYDNLVDKTVNYSGKFFEYYGSGCSTKKIDSKKVNHETKKVARTAQPFSFMLLQKFIPQFRQPVRLLCC